MWSANNATARASLHLEAGGYSKESKDKIISFKDRPAEEANGACLSCHAKSEHVRNWFAGAHASQGLKCADCHSIHAENATLESRRQQNDRCLQCHRKQEAQGSLPYHHPIREGKMSCNDCHDPHGGSGGNNLKLANGNQLCFQCHAEYQGPFSYQHPPVTEDCLKCHSPHGSPNQSLLVVSQPALCLQCHSADLVSQVFVPQSVIGGTADYHFRYGFDSGLRFNYGSYADRIGRVAVNGFARPDLSGRLRSYSVFMGRVW